MLAAIAQTTILMKVNKLILTIAFILCILSGAVAQKLTDYMNYHRGIINAEELIIQNKYSEALLILENIFTSYDYIFLKDYKVATQLALYLGDEERAFNFLRLGILSGWTIKEIEKDKFLKSLRDSKREWGIIKSQYDTLRINYEKKLNQAIRTEVHEMFRKDQKLAFANLFKIGKKAKERFLFRKFIPQSESQITRLKKILNEYGYPGENLIGNGIWMSTILSHHNSISSTYTQKDTLYLHLKPQLRNAIRRGEMSPGDYAIIEDWYVAVKSNRQEAAYGYLNTLTEQELLKSNELRQSIGLRSVETRNQLVDIQEKTGMNFYLDGVFWVKEKINVVTKR